MNPVSLGVMLFDADCGFCTRCAAYVERHAFAVDVRPMQSVDLAALGVSAARAQRELPFVAADGRVSYGHDAVAQVLRSGNPAHRILGRILTLPLVGSAARLGYAQIAAHRHQLPGGTAACALPTEPAKPDR